MKNGIVGAFFCILSFLGGCYLGYVVSEERTLEYNGIELTRYEIQQLLQEEEEGIDA